MHKRFVAKAEAGKNWRVWDRQQKRWWGNRVTEYPRELLAELNGAKRPQMIVELTKSGCRNGREKAGLTERGRWQR